jgi:hypothetical protein
MPRKEFESFTRLDASDVNTFLMDQSVQTFADSTARGSAIATPVEGMVTYLNDIDSLSVYNGTAFTTDRTIQVFAGTAERGSAIGTAVEGMYTHINDTDSLEYYDGSAWVAAGQPFILPGLTFIKKETVSSGVATVAITNVFSSEYDDYKILINITPSVGADFSIRLRDASGAITGANYHYHVLRSNSFTGAAFADLGFGRAVTSAPFDVGVAANMFYSCDMLRPNLSVPTLWNGNGTSTVANNLQSSGTYNANVSATGFEVNISTGTFTGSVSVYGYRKA